MKKICLKMNKLKLKIIQKIFATFKCDFAKMFHKFVLIGKGVTGLVFFAKFDPKIVKPLIPKNSSLKEDSFCVAVKVIPIRKAPQQLDNSGSLIEWKIMEKIHAKFGTIKPYHFLMPIALFSCKKEELSNRFQEIISNEFKQKWPNISDKYDSVKMMVTDFIGGGSLDNFLKATPRNSPIPMQIVLSLLFQLTATCAQICSKFPNFVHGDLHRNNILLKKIAPETLLTYIIKGKKYQIKSFGFKIIIIDLERAQLPNIPNSKKMGNNLNNFYQSMSNWLNALPISKKTNEVKNFIESSKNIIVNSSFPFSALTDPIFNTIKGYQNPEPI
jgi:Protein tyrosine and serine/threonine kinase